MGVLFIVFLRTTVVMRSELSSECCRVEFVETSPEFVDRVSDRIAVWTICKANIGVECFEWRKFVELSSQQQRSLRIQEIGHPLHDSNEQSFKTLVPITRSER